MDTIALTILVVTLLAVVVALLHVSRQLAAIRGASPAPDLRIEVPRWPDDGPLVVVNAGAASALDAEITLRFEPRTGGDDRAFERFHRARVVLPGERIGFPSPRSSAEEVGAALAHVTAVRLLASADDASGVRHRFDDVLVDPMVWVESARRTGSAVVQPAEVLRTKAATTSSTTDASSGSWASMRR